MRRSSVSKVVAVVALAATVVVGFGIGQASAAQIFIQQNANGGAPAGGDPNIITDTSAFVIGLAGQGSGPTQNPLLVIVADYNGVGPAPTFSFSGCSTPSACDAATVGTYGLTANKVTGFNSGTVFDAVGLADAGGSVSFNNMSDADVALGLAAPTSFTLYVFALPTQLLGGGTITVDTTAGSGDFISAYACNQQGNTEPCGGPGSTNNNVFTNTGLVNNVPEPASAVLLGSALIGLGLLRRRSKS